MPVLDLAGVAEAGLIGGGGGEGAQDGAQKRGAGRQAGDLGQGDEAVLYALAQQYLLRRYRQAGGVQVDGPRPGGADDEVDALHRVTGLLLDLEIGRAHV